MKIALISVSIDYLLSVHLQSPHLEDILTHRTGGLYV